jgi:hypothetical protein
MASRFMERPTTKHKTAMKQIMRYIKGTLDFGIVYTQAKAIELLVGYSDSDIGGDLVGRRSTGGMALSSCEAEFMAAIEAANSHCG